MDCSVYLLLLEKGNKFLKHNGLKSYSSENKILFIKI